MKTHIQAVVRGAFALTLFATLFAVFADSPVTFTDIPQVQFAPYCYKSGTNGYSAVTKQVPDDIPAALQEHILFRLDASNRAGWLYRDAACTEVTNLPSAYGTRSANIWPMGGNARGGVYGFEPPVVVTDDASFGNRPYLDFGVYKSGRGLLFNPVTFPDATVASNRLEGIGTVISVYGSQNAGGDLIGGPYRTSDGSESMDGYAMRGYQWHTDKITDYTPVTYANKLFTDCGPAYACLRDATVRQNGLIAAASSVGLSGEWEILTIIPTKPVVDAAGIGINSLQTASINCGGGMRIAETIYFDKTLTTEEAEEVEAYLSKKWGLHTYHGYRGNAHLGYLYVMENTQNIEGYSVTVATEGDETCTIDYLRGGRGRDTTLVKTGTGTLKIGDAGVFGGSVVLRGGTLDMTKRAIPTEDELPANCYLHVDASSANAFAKDGAISTEGGTNYVQFWANEANTTWKGVPLTGLCCDKDKPERRPWVIQNALGTGLHAVDFGNGWFGSDSATCAPQCYLRITTNLVVGATANETSLKHVTTVVAAMGAHRGGGTLISGSGGSWNSYISPFMKGGGNLNNNGCWYQAIVMKNQTKINGAFYAAEQTVLFDGRKVNYLHSFESPSYHTLAVQSNGMDCHTVGAWCESFSSPKRPGALRLCEMFVYDHVLTEQEMLDAEAYLAWKWYGKVNPGYRRPASVKTPDLAKLRVEAASTIVVPTGTTIRIGEVVANAPLAKTGEGVLEIGALTCGAAGGVTGSNVRGLSEIPDVSAKCEVAAGASFHIDPSRSETLTIGATENGTNWIARIDSIGGNNVAGTGQKPYDKGGVTMSAAESCNGLPVLDFGTYANYSGRYLNLGYPLENVRSVFMVWGTQRGGGRMMGAASGNLADSYSAAETTPYTHTSVWDFFRDNGLSGYNTGIMGNNQNDIYGNGGFATVYTNGVKVAMGTRPLGCYQLVEVHCPMGMAVGVIQGGSNNGASTWTGGGLVGETIIYERDLSEREKVATRNYLLKKWFGESEANLPELPAKETLPGDVLSDNAVVADAVDAVSDADRTVRILSGAGDLSKGGAGTLTLVETKDFTGTLVVTGGTVKLAGVPQAVEPQLATNGLTVRLDASVDVGVNTNGTLREVVAWHNQVKTGDYKDLRAVGQVVPGAVPLGVASLDTAALAGKDVVNANLTGQGLYFKDADGNILQVTNVVSAFWVLDSAAGGGVPLMGGINDTYYGTDAVDHGRCLNPITRGGSGSDPASPIIRHGSSKDQCSYADFRLGGAALGRNPSTGYPLAWTVGFSGDWDVFSMNLREQDTNSPIVVMGLAASGNSYHGDYQTGGNKINYYYNAGHVRLAEVLLYSRRLSEEEVLGTETYLARKWGLLNLVESATNGFDIALGADGTLDLGGTNRVVRSLAGAGAITNGTIETSALVYDFGVGGPLALDEATFAFGPGFAVTLAGTPVELPAGGQKLLGGVSFAGRENFSRKALANNPDGRYTLSLRADGLYLRERTGLAILIR